jgi:hypothetical protein
MLPGAGRHVAVGKRRKLLEFLGQLVDAEDVPPDALIGEEEAAAGGELMPVF